MRALIDEVIPDDRSDEMDFWIDLHIRQFWSCVIFGREKWLKSYSRKVYNIDKLKERIMVVLQPIPIFVIILK